ncbi:MAG: thioredoxin [Rhizobiales bacterium]|nr:thioredoxin [Hyphomicrobiales bacterium]
MNDAADLVKDTTTQDFRQDVLMESMKQPVLVDFWAPWCGPCKQLTPVIEKVVKAAKGRIKLVKMNIDEHPQVAGQLGVQSIPAVFAFQKGQPVDGFMGALPESQVKGFIERLIGPMGADLAAMLDEAKALLDAGDAAGAMELFAGILGQEPENMDALGGLIRSQIVGGALIQAEQMLARVPPEQAHHAAIAGARAAFELAKQVEALGDVTSLQRKVEANPLDHQARFDLALALNAHGKREEAVDELIAIIKKDRSWNEDGARKQLLQFFEAWGGQDDATVTGRRRLSATLFS